MSDLTVSVTTNQIDLNVSFQGDFLDCKVLSTINVLSINKDFETPQIFHGNGNPNDGVVRAGDYVVVYTTNGGNPYIFKGWCIQSGSTNYFDQDYYTEDFN